MDTNVLAIPRKHFNEDYGRRDQTQPAANPISSPANINKIKPVMPLAISQTVEPNKPKASRLYAMSPPNAIPNAQRIAERFSVIRDPIP